MRTSLNAAIQWLRTLQALAARCAKITMREARVAGCRDSSIVPARPCGKPWESEGETRFGNAGQKRPGDLRVLCSKPQLQGITTRIYAFSTTKKNTRHETRRLAVPQ